MSDEEWVVYSQADDREREDKMQRWEAEKAARREAEEKAAWIAQRRAEDRIAAGKNLLLLSAKILVPLLLVLLLVFFGYPAYRVYQAQDAVERGDYARAVLRYRQAADWGLFDSLFHAGEKAESMVTAERLAACTAGVSDKEIPKGAVRLSGTAQGQNGPITVEVIADSDRIYRVAVTEHTETEGIGGEAAKIIPKRIYQAQNASVDAVTGATVSSRAICQAVINALSSDAAWTAKIYPWKFGTVTPMPPATPTPGPMPEELKVFFYENELEEFTEKVDESVRLKVVAYPEGMFDDAVFHWSIDDPYILKLSVSESTRECVVTCLSSRSGYVTLTVECNGATKEIWVYTRR